MNPFDLVAQLLLLIAWCNTLDTSIFFREIFCSSRRNPNKSILQCLLSNISVIWRKCQLYHYLDSHLKSYSEMKSCLFSVLPTSNVVFCSSQVDGCLVMFLNSTSRFLTSWTSWSMYRGFHDSSRGVGLKFRGKSYPLFSVLFFKINTGNGKNPLFLRE